MKILSVHRRNPKLSMAQVLKIESLERRIRAILAEGERSAPKLRRQRGPGVKFRPSTAEEAKLGQRDAAEALTAAGAVTLPVGAGKAGAVAPDAPAG